MLHLALIGLILWILYLFWRINTKPMMMPGKDGKTQPPSAKEDPSVARPPPPGERASSAVPSASEQNAGPGPRIGSASRGREDDEAAGSSGARPPKPRSGSETRERLKFILGASEDNSSDEEPVVAKPPSGVAQPLTSSLQESPPQQAGSRSTIK